jgi:hypothetical protein
MLAAANGPVRCELFLLADTRAAPDQAAQPSKTAELFLMTTSPKTRAERDTFGPIDVPADKLWGAQTQRSLQNFDISGEQQPREIIKALAQVKRASAVVNHRWASGREEDPGHRGRGRRSLAGKHEASSRWWSGRPARARRPT